MDAERRDEFAAAISQTGLLFGAALAFCSGVFLVRGPEDATAWFAAYILEESLSVDNLFVFSLIFDYFQTPANAQPRVLRWGLIVAVVLRAAFIFAGLAAVQRFKGVLLFFAVLLLYSSYSLLSEEEEEEDLSQNMVVQLTQKYLPSSDKYDGERFITKVDGATSPAAGTLPGLLDGSSLVTPLLLALVCVELSDVLFAVDSIPAVFGVTTDPFIALTSNGFAILGLRALYTVVAQAVDDFKYLRPAIAIVLGFIGAKLIGEFAGFEVSTLASLVVVATTLGAGVGASVLLKDEYNEAE
jgi:TerC family integral membrane protein